MNKLGKIAMGVVGVGAVCALGALVFMRINRSEEPIAAIPLPSVVLENPVRATIELNTGLTGTIEPSDSVYIIPKASGEVLEVYVQMGDTVESGQALFRIDNKQLDAAKITLDQVRLSLNDAQTNLSRMKVLYESGDISAQAYEQVENGVAQARLQLQSAQLNYDLQSEFSTVTAPIGGVLEQFNVSEHDMVSAGVVGMVSGVGSKAVTFSVTERVKAGLAVGDTLVIEKNGMEYNGTITEIGSMVDQMTGLFKVKASLEAADALATGTMVKLYVTAQRAEDVMTLPTDCLSYAGGDAFVYVYHEANQTVSKIQVEIGLIDSEKAEIKSGLNWEDEVVVTWSKEIYDGAQVNLAKEAH